MSTDSKERPPKTVRSRLVIKVAVFGAAAFLVVWAVFAFTKGPTVPFEFLANSKVLRFREHIIDSKTAPPAYGALHVYEVRESRKFVADSLAKEAKARKWRKLNLNPKHHNYLSSEYHIHAVPLSDAGPVHVHVYSNRPPTFFDFAKDRLGMLQGEGFTPSKRALAILQTRSIQWIRRWTEKGRG